MNEDKQLENIYKQNSTENAKLANEHYTKLSSESIKTLEDAIKRMHIEIDFASKAFGGNAQESIASLKSTRDSLISVLNQLTEPLAAFKSNNTVFDNSLQTFAVIPDKIKNQISLLPEYLKKSIASGIPQVSKELVENQANHNKLLQKSFEESIESFKGKTNDIISEFNKEISYYKQELIKTTELSAKNRTRRLFITLLIAGGFSALVSGFTSWYINSKYPHSVELHDNGAVTVNNSKVLVVDPDSSFNKGKKP